MRLVKLSKIEHLEPLERLKKLEKALKRKRSLQGIRTAVSEVLKCKPSEMREFSYRINNHKFRGIVYLKRNNLMGTIVALWDNKQKLILRGYPKIKYATDSRVKGKKSVVQEKLDGTNIGLFRLPDGTLWGKTRLTADFRQESFNDKSKTWKGLLEQVRNGSTLRRIKKLLDEKNYIVYGELYGTLNPGEFIKYSVPIDFKVFDIVDRNTMRFLPPQKVYDICFQYGIPRVKSIWSGILTSKEIERLEYEAKKYLHIDGSEGFVAKAEIGEDMYFCKLKCEEIKEKCWSISGKKPSIPTLIIRKAIRKTVENYPEKKTIDEIYSLVYEELKEEVEEELINQCEKKIRGEIRHYITPSNQKLLPLVIQELKELKTQGIDLNDKSTVLSHLAGKLGEIKGSTLYMLYKQALRELGE